VLLHANRLGAGCYQLLDTGADATELSRGIWVDNPYPADEGIGDRTTCDHEARSLTLGTPFNKPLYTARLAARLTSLSPIPSYTFQLERNLASLSLTDNASASSGHLNNRRKRFLLLIIGNGGNPFTSKGNSGGAHLAVISFGGGRAIPSMYRRPCSGKARYCGGVDWIDNRKIRSRIDTGRFQIRSDARIRFHMNGTSWIGGLRSDRRNTQPLGRDIGCGSVARRLGG
jgi:hypothetical protein